VTARFQVVGHQDQALPDVVFRAIHFPVLESSAYVHAFLSRHCRGVVPEVLAWKQTDKGSFLLYRAFDIAMCLAVVKELHHEWRWAEIMAWTDGNPEWTAQLINRLWQHRQRLQNA